MEGWDYSRGCRYCGRRRADDELRMQSGGRRIAGRSSLAFQAVRSAHNARLMGWRRWEAGVQDEGEGKGAAGYRLSSSAYLSLRTVVATICLWFPGPSGPFIIQ